MKEVKGLATQIAPTPTLKGKDAAAVKAEMKRAPSAAAKRGAVNLLAKYSRMAKK